MLRREEALAVAVAGWELATALGGIARSYDGLETLFEFSVLLLEVKHFLVAVAQE